MAETRLGNCGIRIACLGALALVCCGAGTADAADAADAADDGILTLQGENDVVSGTDKDYTNGLRLQYLSPEVSVDHVSQRIAREIPFLQLDDKLRFGVALGQSLFTPRQTGRADLIPDDRPYAGWLYLSLSILSYDDSSDVIGETGNVSFSQSLVLDLGVVGPAAGGEFVQNEFHSLIGVDRAQGWDNQLDNEPGIMLTYERKWRQWRIDDFAVGPVALDMDLMPHFGGAAGNVMTYAALGAGFRIGQGIERDFGPPRVRPGMPGSGHFRPNGVSWYLFAGADGRAVARNIFLDGNSFQDSHRLDRRILVGDVQAGLVITFGNMRVSYTQVLRSPEADGLSSQRFGSFALSWAVDF